MAAMAVWVGVLIMYGVWLGTVKNSDPDCFPLDMAPNSVDDMYDGCKDKMKSKVKKQYLAKEKNKDKNFKLAWAEANTYYNNKWNKRKKGSKCKGNASIALGKEKVMAIYAYTLEKPNIYRNFIDAVRSQKCNYTTTFKYHSLHFYLTDAIQTLNAGKDKCLTVYRRVHSYFSQNGLLNKKVRFGSFTSASNGSYLNAAFGNKSCFEIVTCFGADISPYSKYVAEREVLIPPYEVFSVTKMEKRKSCRPCEVVYELKSTGTLSTLNCTLFQ